MSLLFFVLVVNGVLVGGIFALETITQWYQLQFLSDYFFYALIPQWALALFFSMSPPTSTHHWRHSGNRATKSAASLVESTETQSVFFNVSDLALSTKLYVSGGVCLVCLLVF
ncbi:hypothetical protein [Vibrio sonorensis]|uniref:hypothetical protein n=1 Tax=Vibrio sonorensis TaxID=1004316 RepID=UPI0008D9B144|nr:hypothetical protein [Vibrio sonorensis]